MRMSLGSEFIQNKVNNMYVNIELIRRVILSNALTPSQVIVQTSSKGSKKTRYLSAYLVISIMFCIVEIKDNSIM